MPIQQKTIIFDVNKTLIQENSWQELNLALGVTQAEDDMLMSWGQANIITDQQGQDILCAIYKQRSNPSIDVIANVLSAYTYMPGAKELVNQLKARGYTVALLSGSMDLLVQLVAQDFGVDHWRAANTFIFDSQDNLDHIIAPQTNDADEKVTLLYELADEIGDDPHDCYVVGDGDNDQKLFELTGRGITFTNSTIADQAWQTVIEVSEIGDILT